MDADKDFEEFASLLIAELSKQVDPKTISRAESGNLLNVGGCQANLRSLFRNYAVAPENGVSHLVATIIETLDRGEHASDVPSWEEAKDKVRPKLWDRLMMGKNDVGMPFKLVGEHLMLSIVLDQTHSMQVIPRQWLDVWGVSFEDALQVGFANIAPPTQLMGVKSADESHGHCSTATNDCYDSVRFLLEKPYEAFQIGYPRFAFPSARDMCVMAMANYPDDLAFCIDLALEFGDDDPKPLPPFPLVNAGDGWRNWTAVPGSKLERMLAKRQFAYLFNGYAHQSRDLQEDLDELGDFVLVESFRRWPASSDELPKSFTNWPAGTETLLPQTDYVVFPDRGGLRVAWKDLTQVCGDKLVPAEALYPQRWRTDGDPSDAEFERLESLSLD